MDIVFGTKLEEPVRTVIGQWADYFNYDPDGLCGPPTPRDPELEDYLFGPIAKLVREMREI